MHTKSNKSSQLNRILLYILPCIALSIVGMLYIASHLVSVSSANAESSSDSMNVSVQAESLNVSLESNSITLDIAPTYEGIFKSTNPVKVYVDTTNTYGYNLIMTATTTTSLTSTVPLSDGTTYPTIATLGDNNGGSGYDSTNFPTNRWGYAVNGSNFLPVANSTTLRTTDGTDNTADRTNNLSFGTKLNTEITTGNYNITLNFVATTNSPSNLEDFDAAFIFAGKTKYNGYYKMQDMTANICSYVATPTSSAESPTIQLIDIRDNNIYSVSKMADGKCWMMENLRLDGDRTITPDDTNIESNYTLAANNNTSPSTLTDIDEIFSVNANNSDAYGNKYGNLYNLCAASGGTVCAEPTSAGSFPYDICPKGWKLPNGGTKLENGSYTSDTIALLSAYGIGQNTFDSSTPSFSDALTLLQTKMRIPLSGELYGVISNWQDTVGRNMSLHSNYIPDIPNRGIMQQSALLVRTSATDGNIITASNFSISPRYHKVSVRCLARTSISDLTYMQEFANLTDAEKEEVKTTMATGTAYQLIDNRDNEVYNVAKLADGNVWLLDNLRLDPATLLQQLTPANTNMDPSTPFTLPESISINFNSFTEPNINTDYKNTTAASSGAGSGKIGVYYNYCAASAGTYCYQNATDASNATYDICPASWKMPNGDSGNGSFNNLLSVYGGKEGEDSTEFKNALSLVLSGVYYDSNTEYIGQRGYYMSNTKYNAIDMRGMRIDADAIYPRNGLDRMTGRSVRCRLK